MMQTSDSLSGFVKRSVIIQKDERGYGLRVSGESPVTVESVKEDGAAWKSGVRNGDRIIKVNGTLVMKLGHGEVVKMIQNSCSYVGLTLMRPKIPPAAAPPQHLPFHITGPQPAPERTQQEYEASRVTMFNEMLKQEKRHLSELSEKKKDSREIEVCLKRIKSLEAQLENLNVSRQRHASMSAENLATVNADYDEAGIAAAKKSHSFGQYDTKGPIMNMESDEEGMNDDVTNNNNHMNKNSLSHSNHHQIHSHLHASHLDIPNHLEEVHGHSLRMTRWLLSQQCLPHALLFYTMAGHVYPALVLQGTHNRRTITRWAWQIACTWLLPDSPLAFHDFSPDVISVFDATLESTHSALDSIFIPFLGVSRDKLQKQLDNWRSAAKIGLAPLSLPSPKDELNATLETLLIDSSSQSPSSSLASLEYAIDNIISQANPNNVSKVAIVSCLSTIAHHVFGCHSHPSHHLLSDVESSSPPPDSVLRLSLDHSSGGSSGKKHKRHSSCPAQSRNAILHLHSPGHHEGGHYFVSSEMSKVQYCNYTGCLLVIWGAFGLVCSHCQLCVHIWCMKNASSDSPCPGPPDSHQTSELVTPVNRGGTGANNRNNRRNRRWKSSSAARPLLDMIKKTTGIAQSHLNESSHAPPLLSSTSSDDEDESSDNISTNDENVMTSSTYLTSGLTAITSNMNSINSNISGPNNNNNNSNSNLFSTSTTPTASNLTLTSSSSGLGLVSALHSQQSVDEQSHSTSQQQQQHSQSPLQRSESYKQRRSSRPEHSYRKRSDPFALNSKDKNSVSSLSSSSHPNTSILAGTSSSVTTTDSSDPRLTLRSPATTPGSWQSSSDDEDKEDNQHNESSASPQTGNSNVNINDASNHVYANANNACHVNQSADTPPPLPPRPPSEKRKQIHAELIDTEERHVETLRLLKDLYYKPMLADQLLTQEQLETVFSNTSELLKIHKLIFKKLKNVQNQSLSGDNKVKPLELVLAEIFCGKIGKRLETQASLFCANQKQGVDTLRAKKKDTRFSRFLDPEARYKENPECQIARLSIEDLLGAVFQRPTKYPLLLDRLLHATPTDSPLYSYISKATARSKEIVNQINEAVRESESKRRLADIIRKTERLHGLVLDFEGHSLLHEGAVTWRITKQKCVDCWMVLTDRTIVILTKDSEKYILRTYSSPQPKNQQNSNQPTIHSPILYLEDLITRDVATDPTAFFLVSSKQNFFFEFSASAPNERKSWTEHIASATNSRPNTRNTTQTVTKLRDLTSPPSLPPSNDNNLAQDERDNNLVKKDVNSNSDSNLTSNEVMAKVKAIEEKEKMINQDKSIVKEEDNNHVAKDMLSNASKKHVQIIHLPSSSSTDIDIPPPIPPPSRQIHTPRIEGVIRIVTEDEVHAHDLIPPSMVKVSSVETVCVNHNQQQINELEQQEVVTTLTCEQKLADIDDKVETLLNQKRNVLGQMQGLSDQYEWSIICDLANHDDSKEDSNDSRTEVTFFDKAMSVVTMLARNGLTEQAREPLISLRDTINSILTKLPKPALKSNDLDQVVGLGTALNESDMDEDNNDHSQSFCSAEEDNNVIENNTCGTQEEKKNRTSSSSNDIYF